MAQWHHMNNFWHLKFLTHWGQVMHKWFSNLTITGSDNVFLPVQHQVIILTNAEILLIGPLGTNLSEILIEILIFSFKKMHLKVSSVKWQPFCLIPNVLIRVITTIWKHASPPLWPAVLPTSHGSWWNLSEVYHRSDRQVDGRCHGYQDRLSKPRTRATSAAGSWMQA